jgi:hypothetical protein
MARIRDEQVRPRVDSGEKGVISSCDEGDRFRRQWYNKICCGEGTFLQSLSRFGGVKALAASSKRGSPMFENTMLFFVITANMSLLLTLLRLSIKHRELLIKLNFGRSVYGFADTLARLLEFIIRRRYAKLSDPILTLSCIAFMLSLLISLPMMFLAIIFHK